MSRATRMRKIIDVETLIYVARPVAESAQASLSNRIRVATKDDVAGLTELGGAGRWRLQQRRRRRRIARRFERGDTCVVYELPDGTLGGCDWLATQPHRIDRYRVPVRLAEGEGYVYGLQVRVSERKKGIGVALTDAVREQARSAGMTLLGGYISRRNPATPHIFFNKRPHTVTEDVTVLVLLNRWGLVLRRRKRAQPTSPAVAEQLVV